MPQRFLRPGIRTSESWNKTSFHAQSLYIALLTLVDDEGRYDGRPRLIHSECFGLRDDVKLQQTAADLRELASNDLVLLYSVNGKEYLQFLRWSERARNKSKYPPPSEADQQPTAADSSQRVPPSSSPSSSSSPVATTIVPFAPTQLRWSIATGWEGVSNELKTEWLKAFPACNIDIQLRQMALWLRSNPKKATKSNWLRFVISWLKRAQDRGGDTRSNRLGPGERPMKIV